MDVKEKYKEKIEKLNAKYMYERDESIHCEDCEEYHIEWDNLLIELLKEIGYEEISEQYENVRNFFWYT